MDTREPDWKSEPGEGMLNCLYISAGDEDGTVKLKLVVVKPRCEPWQAEALVHAPLEDVQYAVSRLGDKWVQLREDRKGNIYTAKRIIPISGCKETVVWRVNHTDVRGDKTMYTIVDSFKSDTYI